MNKSGHLDSSCPLDWSFPWENLKTIISRLVIKKKGETNNAFFVCYCAVFWAHVKDSRSFSSSSLMVNELSTNQCKHLQHTWKSKEKQRMKTTVVIIPWSKWCSKMAKIQHKINYDLWYVFFLICKIMLQLAASNQFEHLLGQTWLMLKIRIL